MRGMRTAVLVFALLASTTHDRSFWQAIVASKYAVPAGADVHVLIDELNSYLGSTDPVLRDDIAYSTMTSWIYDKRVVPNDDLRRLAQQWLANLETGVGERGNDRILLRSFSALSLATVAALDNKSPFLTADEYRAILNGALRYIASEKDLRGFDAKKGWMHATAHTADLLKFLARNPKLEVKDQRTIFDALVARMQSADVVFTHGEDERLARVAISLAARPDFDAAQFRDALGAIRMPEFAADETVLTKRENTRRLLTSMFAVMSADERQPVRDAAAAVLAALKKMG